MPEYARAVLEDGQDGPLNDDESNELTALLLRQDGEDIWPEFVAMVLRHRRRLVLEREAAHRSRHRRATWRRLGVAHA